MHSKKKSASPDAGTLPRLGSRLRNFAALVAVFNDDTPLKGEKLPDLVRLLSLLERAADKIRRFIVAARGGA